MLAVGGNTGSTSLNASIEIEESLGLVVGGLETI